MFQENTLSPRRKHKRSSINAEVRERRFAREEKEARNSQRHRPGHQRPATKRTLHYFMKLWQATGEECLQILDGDPEYDWDPHVLRSR